MRRLTEDDLHILAVVAKHDRVCIGLPVDAEWAPIAEHLRRLTKWKYLLEDSTDDGPAYSLSPSGHDRLSDP